MMLVKAGSVVYESVPVATMVTGALDIVVAGVI